MTLNQRKSELYAVAAISVAVGGLLPDLRLWWEWGWGMRRGDEANETYGVELRDASEEHKEEKGILMRNSRNPGIWRGAVVVIGGVFVGGWTVWS